jgi:Tol biopolymer transport system component
MTQETNITTVGTLLAALFLFTTGCAARVSAENEGTLSEIVQLTRGFSRAGEAYMSVDGSWLIFQAVPEGEEHYQMYVAATVRDGDRLVGIDRVVRISPPNSRNTCGWFTADGKSIVFSSTAGKEDASLPAPGYQRQGRDYRWSYPPGMEIFRADGWQEAVLSTSSGMVNLAQHALTDNDAYDAEASATPDGRQLVFTSNRDGDLELYAMSIDGGPATRLTHAPGYDGGPFVSPDGKRVVYRSDRKGNDLLQIFVSDLVFDSDGRITGLTNEKQLTDEAAVNWGPYWHPSGRHIIYSSSGKDHSNYELFLIRDDGQEKTRITWTPGADVLPTFSPDGKHLLWASKRTEDKTVQIFGARFRLPTP